MEVKDNSTLVQKFQNHCKGGAFRKFKKNKYYDKIKCGLQHFLKGYRFILISFFPQIF